MFNSTVYESQDNLTMFMSNIFRVSIECSVGRILLQYIVTNANTSI